MWRTTDDINDTYSRMAIIAQSQDNLAPFAGPGHWNDPDMLEVGNGGMTEDEYRTHMTFWALLAAPLLAGNDLSKMSDTDKRLLMNREVIAIDQDPLGKQARRISQIGDYSVWARPLKDGRVAVGVFNGSRDKRWTSVDLGSLGLGTSVKVHDVWQAKDLGPHSGTFARVLPKSGSMLLIVSR
jgi:alpha-galactosidase